MQHVKQLGQSVASVDDTFEGFTFVDSSSHLHSHTNGSGNNINGHPLSSSSAGSSSTTTSSTAAAVAAAKLTVVSAGHNVSHSASLRPLQGVMVDLMDTPDS